MNVLIMLAILLGLITLGGTTNIVLRHRKDWVEILLNIALWACFAYVLYLIIGA